jgi:predicted amidophosphoribosyltransferase
MRSIASLFFPPLCLHCEAAVQKNKALFCDECSFFFEPLEWKNRCRTCGQISEQNHSCKECRDEKRSGYKVAATLEYQASVFSMLARLREGKMPYLAKTGASLMLLQFMELKWDPPECVTVFRTSVIKRLLGQNSTKLLAQYFCRFLKVPMSSKVEDKSVLVIADSLEEAPEEMEKILDRRPRKAALLTLTTKH